MARLSKRAQAIMEKVTPGRQYPVDEALALLQELSSVKFKESVDVSVNLGVDPRKSDQAVRGSTVLPNGTGKTVRVAVFTQGPNVEAATAAGAPSSGKKLGVLGAAALIFGAAKSNTVRVLLDTAGRNSSAIAGLDPVR